ncbi:gamma-glutamylcyclotransferase family protein [Nitrosophilus kaiyonis]|uniref:gamma-glutamylcyclotransferase family protein n=1 Tax=Nitrosophilus kaiyonis TaxID=2930200 RepID=UPI002490E217|nr:gamma-glutamylcyclotransferase [Nitrosophilus kaiyonis]
MRYEYLFVYGTLMSKFNNRYSKFLRKYSKFIGPGYIKGEIFQISWYPGVKKSLYFKNRVKGELYLIKNPKKVFKILDKYEDASKFNLKNYEYKREKYCVNINRKIVNSWVYFYKNS